LESCASATIAAARSRRSDPTESRVENSLLCTMLQKAQNLLQKHLKEEKWWKFVSKLLMAGGGGGGFNYLVTNSEHASAMTKSTHGRGLYA
jgi:hypothetical protein